MTQTQSFDLRSDAEFVRALDAAVQRHAMLSHPFYQAWSQGALSLDDLREYSKQYFHHVKAFPRYVSGVHSNCDDLGLRQELLQNLSEEEHGQPPGVVAALRREPGRRSQQCGERRADPRYPGLGRDLPRPHQERQLSARNGGAVRL